MGWGISGDSLRYRNTLEHTTVTHLDATQDNIKGNTLTTVQMESMTEDGRMVTLWSFGVAGLLANLHLKTGNNDVPPQVLAIRMIR